MFRLALTAAILLATTGCAKPGCGYSAGLQSAVDRAGMSLHDSRAHEDEFRTRCGLGERRTRPQAQGRLRLTCVTVNSRTTCR